MIEVRIGKSFPSGKESAGFSLDVEFSAEAGISALFGSSGAGKTLTLDSIAGFARPDAGRILLDGAILFDAVAGVHLAPRDRRCGYVFQNYALFPNMTLRQNLEFAAERQPRLERHRRINETIERFRLGDVAGRKPHQLSGGQKQRCSIARALVGVPKILLLDEPSRGLDAPLRADLYAVLRQVHEDFRIPILLVTHDLEECFQLAQNMLVMREGRIVQSGPPRDVLSRPASREVAQLLGGFNLLQGEIRALDPGRNSSRIRVGEFELTGPYFPGHLIGDRISICSRTDAARALPRDGRPSENQIAVELLRVIPRAAGLRLEFSGELAAECPGGEIDAAVTDWVLEFPPHSLQII